MSLAILPWTVRSTCGPVAVAEGCTAPAINMIQRHVSTLIPSPCYLQRIPGGIRLT